MSRTRYNFAGKVYEVQTPFDPRSPRVIPLTNTYFINVCSQKVPTKCHPKNMCLILTPQSRLDAGLVCRFWARALSFRSTWAHLEVDEENLRDAGLMHYKYNHIARSEEV